jgi:hypothetical protein
LIFALQVAPGEIYADRISIDMVQGVGGGDVVSPFSDGDDKLDLVVHVLCLRRIWKVAPARQYGIRRLLEEERRFAFIVSHLADMFGVIAADAVNSADWKAAVLARYLDRRRRLRGNHIVHSLLHSLADC